MRTVGEFDLVPVWVHPTHLVSSAIMLMRGHGVKMLPVVTSEDLVGVVTLDRLTFAPSTSEVEAFIEPNGVTLTRDTPVRTAAELFVKADANHAVVFEAGRVFGTVTSTMLLAELGRSWDPLTNLSWSDTLREWGIDRLSSGLEVTILFMDLDDFGKYNKSHGHVVGDKILRKISNAFKRCIDPERDLLVRYAGDEFAIGTTRPLEYAVALSQELLESAKQSFEDDPHFEVTFSVGMSGGKRTKERESVHYAATLDALINLASKDAEANKRRKAEPSIPGLIEPSEPTENDNSSPEPSPVEQASLENDESGFDRPKVMFVLAEDSTPSAPTTVGMSCDGGFPTGVHMRGGIPLVESVAIAAANALSQFPGRVITISEVTLSEPNAGQKLVTVSAALTDDHRQFAVAATRPVSSGLYETVAETVIDAYMQRTSSHDGSTNGGGQLIDMYGQGFRQAE